MGSALASSTSCIITTNSTSMGSSAVALSTCCITTTSKTTVASSAGITNGPRTRTDRSGTRLSQHTSRPRQQRHTARSCPVSSLVVVAATTATVSTAEAPYHLATAGVWPTDYAPVPAAANGSSCRMHRKTTRDSPRLAHEHGDQKCRGSQRPGVRAEAERLVARMAARMDKLELQARVEKSQTSREIERLGKRTRRVEAAVQRLEMRIDDTAAGLETMAGSQRHLCQTVEALPTPRVGPSCLPDRPSGIDAPSGQGKILAVPCPGTAGVGADTPASRHRSIHATSATESRQRPQRTRHHRHSLDDPPFPARPPASSPHPVKPPRARRAIPPSRPRPHPPTRHRLPHLPRPVPIRLPHHHPNNPRRLPSGLGGSARRHHPHPQDLGTLPRRGARRGARHG